MNNFALYPAALSGQYLVARWIQRVFGLCLLVSLTACASQVELPQDFWQGSAKAVGVVFVKPPTMDAHRSGREGLLGMAINEVVTDTVEAHLASLDFDNLEKSSFQIKAYIESRGSTAVVIPRYYEASEDYLLPDERRTAGHFEYDLSSLVDQYTIDYLLVIQVLAAGTNRNYFRFVPVSDPRGYIKARAILVDTSDNRIVLQEDIVEEVSIREGAEWDDPDNGYPELTAAVNKALEQAGASVVQTLSGR